MSSSETGTPTTSGESTTSTASTSTTGATSTSTSSESSSEASGDTSTGSTSSDDGNDSSTTGGVDGEWMTTCPHPFGGPVCNNPNLNAACNQFTQDCPEGSKCAFNDGDLVEWFFLEETCLPLIGDKAIGEPCRYADGWYLGPDDCGPDSWCNNVDYETMIGECVEQCSCDAACSVPGAICQQSGYASYCGYKCDPLLAEAACPEGWFCQPEIGSGTPDSPGAFTCKPQYATPESPGWPCPHGWTTINSLECVQLCSPDGEFPCDDGFVCNQLEDSPLGFCPVEIGRCDPA